MKTLIALALAASVLAYVHQSSKVTKEQISAANIEAAELALEAIDCKFKEITIPNYPIHCAYAEGNATVARQEVNHLIELYRQGK